MTRYYEMNVDDKFKAESDFVYRKRNGTLWQTGVYYAIAAILVLGLFAMDIPKISGIASAFVIVFVMIFLAVHSIVAIQKHLDLVTSIEFQNALFSSSFRNGKLFSLIISKYDQLYYADAKFYKLFPELIKSNGMVLDNIIAKSENAEANLQLLNDALINRNNCAVDVYIDMEGEKELVRISVIPLPRPSGYFFVSARLFQVNRSNEVTNNYLTSEEAENLLGDLFSNKQEIAYLLDNNSNILACTEGFAGLVGVEEKQQLVGRKMIDFVAQRDNYSEQHFNHASFNHENIELKGRAERIIPANISHFYIHNHDNSPKITLGKVLLEQR
jgi:PAS domain-containing protein